MAESLVTVPGRKMQGYLHHRRRRSGSVMRIATAARAQLVVRSTASEQPRSAKGKGRTCQELLLWPTPPFEHLRTMNLIQGLLM